MGGYVPSAVQSTPREPPPMLPTPPTRGVGTLDARRLRVGDLGSHICAAAGRWLQFGCKTTVLDGFGLVGAAQGARLGLPGDQGRPGGRAKIGGCQVR